MFALRYPSLTTPKRNLPCKDAERATRGRVGQTAFVRQILAQPLLKICAGSPTKTLLRLLLPLSKKAPSISRINDRSRPFCLLLFFFFQSRAYECMRHMSYRMTNATIATMNAILPHIERSFRLHRHHFSTCLSYHRHRFLSNTWPWCRQRIIDLRALPFDGGGSDNGMFR